MKKLLTMTVTGVLLATGCASNMRFTAADLDMRRADQITAGQFDAGVVYQARKAPLAVAAPAKISTGTLSVYEKLIAVLPKLAWRVRVFTFESSPAFPPEPTQ